MQLNANNHMAQPLISFLSKFLSEQQLSVLDL